MAGLGFSVNPFGSTGSFGLPEIDPLGKGEVARRAARENEAILKQAQWQQQEAEMAAAKAKAESENQALFDAADKARAAQASTGFMDYANAAIRGAAKGYATTWDLPEIVSTGIHNLPARLLNSGFFSGDKDIYGNKWQRPPNAPPTNAVEEALAKAEAANPPEAMQLDSGQPARGPIEHIPLEDPYTPVLNDFEKAWPPAPGWERSATSDIAGVVAPVVTTLGLGAPEAGAAAAGARAGVPAVERSLLGRVATGAAKTGAITGTSMGGGSALGQLGEWLGSKVNPDFADMLKTYGETLGSAATPEVPGLLAKLGWDAYHNFYAREAGGVDPVTGRVIRDASAARQRLADNRTARIRVSGGNVLNRRAALWEDTASSVPGSSNAAYDARRGQHADMGQVVVDTLNATRERLGLPVATPGFAREINPESQGQAARALGQEAVDRIQQGVDFNYENAAGTGIVDRLPQGRETVLDLQRQRPALQAIHDDPTTERSVQAPIVRGHQAVQDANAIHVIDPALELAFQGRQASIDAMVDGPAKDAARARLADARLANRGPTWETQVDQRRYIHNNDAGAVKPVIQRRLEEAKTEPLRNAPHGVHPDTPASPGDPGGFNVVDTETARLKAQQDLLRASGVAGPDRAHLPAPGTAQTALSGTSGKINTPVRDVLTEHTFTPFTQYLVDQAELKMRGQSEAGNPGVNPEAVIPAQIAKEWSSYSEEVKNMLAPTPELRARMEAGVRSMLHEAARPTRAKPAGGNTMSGPQTNFMGPAIIASNVLGGAGNAALIAKKAITGLIPAVSARLYSKLMTKPANVERIVNPPTFGQSVSLPRILTNAVTSRPAQRRDVLR